MAGGQQGTAGYSVAQQGTAQPSSLAARAQGSPVAAGARRLRGRSGLAGLQPRPGPRAVMAALGAIIAAASLAWFWGVPLCLMGSGGASGGAGAIALGEKPSWHGFARELLELHSQRSSNNINSSSNSNTTTATSSSSSGTEAAGGPRCSWIKSFRTEPDPASCMDPYAHPFSGCFSPAGEAEAFRRLAAGRSLHSLRCGFLDAASQHWLAGVSARYAQCAYVLATLSFSYGALRPIDHVALPQPGFCFVAFVDEPILASLLPPAFNGTHYSRWALEVVDPLMLSRTTARSAHLLKILLPRIFGTTRYSLYVDAKVVPPRDPLRLVRMAEGLGAPHAVVTFRHPKSEDVFSELLADFKHLAKRRLRPGGSVEGVQDAHLRGITGRDFEDLFRQHQYYVAAGYPMHFTGMLDSMLLLWNHRSRCALPLACLWHNQVAYHSMREQLSFNYAVQLAGLSAQVFFVHPFAYNFNDNYTIVPSSWPAAGQYARDAHWCRRRRR